jgi:hypothetical protein
MLVVCGFLVLRLFFGFEVIFWFFWFILNTHVIRDAANYTIPYDAIGNQCCDLLHLGKQTDDEAGQVLGDRRALLRLTSATA